MPTEPSTHDDPQVPNIAELRDIAALLRQLVADGCVSSYCLDRAGQWLVEALKYGAFRGSEWREFRCELDLSDYTSKTPYQAITHRVCRFLQKHPKLVGNEAAAKFIQGAPHYAGRSVPDWTATNLPLIADVIDGQADLLEREAKQSAEAPPQAKDPQGPDGSAEADARSLKVDHEALKVSWAGNTLEINQHADFIVLDVLWQSLGKLVYYPDLWRALNPSLVNANTAQQLEAPPAVKDAVSHIKKALQTAGAPYKIKNTRSKGYTITNHHE